MGITRVEEITADLVEETAGAIRIAIRDFGDDDGLAGEIALRLADVKDCPITVEDALAIAFQAIEDCDSVDVDGMAWDGYEADEEGVLNHALYHVGRPGECGTGCPALR